MKRAYAVAVSLALLLATPALATANPVARSASHQQAIDSVIKRGLAQVGVPYSYGGGDVSGPTAGNPVVNAQEAAEAQAQASLGVPAAPAVPKPVGFDASGLILYSFAGVGIKMPRSSGEQYKVGWKVTPDQALPGDLIFYGPEGAQSVAMFVGNGQMLEASTPAVQISPVRTEGMTPYLTRIIE